MYCLVSSLFLTRGVSVRVCTCVNTHTRIHSAHRVLNVSPGVGTRHLEGQENPKGLNLGKYPFVYVYKVHMCIYMLGGRMRSRIKKILQHIYLPKNQNKSSECKTENSNRMTMIAFIITLGEIM